MNDTNVKRYESHLGKKVIENDGRTKAVDWSKVVAATGQPAPTDGEVREAARRHVPNQDGPSGPQQAAEPTVDETPSHRPTTPWAVECPQHGLVCLTSAEYAQQLGNEDALWVCPVCGVDALWDDEHHESMTEDVDVAWDGDDE